MQEDPFDSKENRENVEELMDGLADSKYQCCASLEEACEVYQCALTRPGNFRVLN